MERNYLTAHTKMPPSMPYPRFLADMEISSTAKLLYVRLLDKTVKRALLELEQAEKDYFVFSNSIRMEIEIYDLAVRVLKRHIMEV